jgi:sugar phosphate isomerase/epimerase
MYVSTGGNSNCSAVDYAKSLFEKGIVKIELSGGLYDDDFSRKLRELSSLGANLTLHNYIPFTKNSFVLNLASSDEEIAERSFQHVREALYWSGEVQAQYFAVHAGFLVDPKVVELGNTLNRQALQNKSEALDRFKNRISKLSDFARQYGVNLLIENNVITINNLKNFESNPLLLCTGPEIALFFKDLDNSVQLLLDVGHFKVSCKTFAQDPIEELIAVKPYIGGLHLSDNNGLADTNSTFSSQSWFIDRLPSCEYTVVEVYESNIAILRDQLKVLDTTYD